MKTTFRKVLMIFLAAAIVQSACIITAVTPVQPTPNQPTPIAATSSPNPSDTQMPPPEGVYPPSFASYNEIASRLPQTFNGGGYTLPLDLSQVDNPAEVEFSETQLNLLSKNGFVVAEPVPGQFREFYQIYEQGRYSAAPVFVTTDSIYHVYHLIFDKMLRDLETEHFILDLKVADQRHAGSHLPAVSSLAVHGTGGASPAQCGLFRRGRPAARPARRGARRKPLTWSAPNWH